MKKVIFTLLSFLVFQLTFSQTTYYYVGGAAPTNPSFNTSTYWNTVPGGGGTARTTATASDILIFDGSDISDEPGAQTGPIVWAITSPTSGTGPAQLKFVNSVDVALSRSGSGGTTTVTIAGSTPVDNDPDLVVQAGSTFRIAGTTGSLAIVIGTNATGLVSGDIVFESNGGGTTNQNRLVSLTKGALLFMPGSRAITTENYGFNPFGSSGSTATPAAVAGVVFMAGSSFIYGGGASPFGNNPAPLIDLRTGSNFVFRKATTGITSLFSNKVYANVFVQNNTTLTADGSIIKMDTLTVDAGSTFITHTQGVTPINGNIINNGTIRVPAADPDRDNRIVMINSLPQTLAGAGTYTFADFIISNVSNVSLQRTVRVDSTTIIFGNLTPNGNLTGSGTTVIKTPATLSATGNINVDSFLVKNISDFTGIEIGMSVSGTNIPANTVITNLSTTSGTITLSRAVTANITYTGAPQTLTIFNGQGILPIKFGAVTATLNNGVVAVNWKVLTETDVVKYVVEKSANATSFAEVGSVNASGNTQYNFADANPLKGNSFYRVKAVHNNGQALYSTVLRISNNKGKAGVNVYPNPVVGKIVNLQLANLDKETYIVNVYNDLGQVIITKAINHQGGSSVHTIELPAGLIAGVYRMNLKGNNTSLQQTVVVQ
jgi:hypothetical protein